MTKPFLSVIIPAHNAAEQLPLVLIDVDRYLSQQKYSWEVIVVNNASADNTKEIVKKFIPLIGKIRLINLNLYQGRGGAVRQGMKAARGEWRLCQTAGNNVAVAEFDKMIPYLKKNKLVLIGSRYLPGSEIKGTLPLTQKIAEGFFSMCCRVLFLVKGIKDIHCGFNCFSEEMANKIFPLSVVDNRAFDIEIISLAQRLGCRIKEVPVSWSCSHPSFSLIDCYKILCQTFKIRKRLWTNII